MNLKYIRCLSSNLAKTISKVRKILSNVNVSTVTVPCVWALLVEINKKKRVVEKIRNIVISQLYQIEMRKKKESEQVQLFVYVCFIYLVTNESLTRLNISWIVVTSAINNLSAWNKYFQSWPERFSIGKIRESENRSLISGMLCRKKEDFSTREENTDLFIGTGTHKL